MADFKNSIRSYRVSLHDLFPTLSFANVAIPDMSIHHNFFGNDVQHENLKLCNQKIQEFQHQHPTAIVANGYLEERAFYNTSRFERTIDGLTEYRNIHLGTDFWVPAQTSIHALYDSEVVISHRNDIHKDYGPLLVLKHEIKDCLFYTLYGHLTVKSLALSPKGKHIKKGECFAYVGNEQENGHWVPHLHFQVITNLLGETKNYNGVAFPSEIEIWKKRCPNPDFLFKESLSREQ